MLFAIDPGIKIAGLASFGEDGTLLGAELVKADPVTDPMGPKLWDMLDCNRAQYDTRVMEKMHVYSAKQFAAKGLIELSIIGGWVHPHHMYTYQQWAGSLKEEVVWNRILSRLSPEEKAVLPKKLGPHKDVLAAVGIGLHHLGRLKPRNGY